MLIHARCLAFPVLTVPFVVGVCLFGECATWAPCGGRADLRAIRRANVTCAEAFPGNE